MSRPSVHTRACAPSVTPVLGAGEELRRVVTVQLVPGSRSDLRRDRRAQRTALRPAVPRSRSGQGLVLAIMAAVETLLDPLPSWSPDLSGPIHGATQAGPRGTLSYAMAEAVDGGGATPNRESRDLVLTDRRVLIVGFTGRPSTQRVVPAEILFSVERQWVRADPAPRFLNRDRLRLSFSDGSFLVFAGLIKRTGVRCCCTELGSRS